MEIKYSLFEFKDLYFNQSLLFVLNIIFFFQIFFILFVVFYVVRVFYLFFSEGICIHQMDLKALEYEASLRSSASHSRHKPKQMDGAPSRQGVE